MTNDVSRTSGTGSPWQVFLVYTEWSFAVILAPLPVLAATGYGLFAGDTAGPLILWALLLVQGLTSGIAGLLLVRAWARTAPDGRRDRWGLPRIGVLTGARTATAVSFLPAVLAGILAATGMVDVAVVSACAIAVGVTVLPRLPWWTAVLGTVVVAAGSGAAGLPTHEHPLPAALFLGFGLALRSSLWLAGLVRELDRARATEAELAVAEERLRFARDLHDVTGRDLSAIAVTAELTGRLVERGDPRALDSSREVAHIARSSLAEVRALVRSYRRADLAAELRGTVSLLRSAGITTEITGELDDVPDQHREVAAWTLREAGTNILRHSDATHVSIRITPEAITVVNDGSYGDERGGGGVIHGSGLTGLAERLAVGGALDASRSGDDFRLEVRFDAPAEAVSPKEVGR